jgi:hypothetical protein
MSDEPEPEDDDLVLATDQSRPEPLTTLGELLEAAHARFVARLEEMKKKGRVT